MYIFTHVIYSERMNREVIRNLEEILWLLVHCKALGKYEKILRIEIFHAGALLGLIILARELIQLIHPSHAGLEKQQTRLASPRSHVFYILAVAGRSATSRCLGSSLETVFLKGVSQPVRSPYEQHLSPPIASHYLFPPGMSVLGWCFLFCNMWFRRWGESHVYYRLSLCFSHCGMVVLGLRFETTCVSDVTVVLSLKSSIIP